MLTVIYVVALHRFSEVVFEWSYTRLGYFHGNECFHLKETVLKGCMHVYCHKYRL